MVSLRRFLRVPQSMFKRRNMKNNVCTSHSTKMKEFGGGIAKNNTTCFFIIFYFNLNSEHLKTIIHSFRQENFNNTKFRLILMAVLIKMSSLLPQQETLFPKQIIIIIIYLFHSKIAPF